ACGVLKVSTCLMSSGFNAASPRQRCQPTNSTGSPLRKTIRAASGSHQMLYSAAGVTLPSQHGAPPMITQRPTLEAMPGLRCKAKAMFVRGPRVTKTRLGLDSIVEIMASVAGCFSADFFGGG